jgi:hypothetical protein
MLKIRDEIDLKELEKFGFEYKPMFNSKKEEVLGEYIISFDYEFIRYDYIISAEHRDIMLMTDNRGVDDDNMREFDTLYDLIKADLVEKIEE